MESSEKKFFANPQAYWSSDGSLFIQYYVRDYINARMRKLKYKGDLNHIADRDARWQRAQEIIADMERGIEPPQRKGCRSLMPPDAPRHFANAFVVLKALLQSQEDSFKKITYTGYLSKLRVFDRWMHFSNRGNLPVGKIDVTVAREFMAWMKEKRRSNQTCNAYRLILHELWEMLIADKYLKENPWKAIPMLPKVNVPFRAMSMQVEQVINDNLPVYDTQLWLAVQFIYYDFIRVDELRHLRLHHVNWNLQQITVPATISKTKKERRLIIPDVLFQQLIEKRYHEIDPDYFLFSRSGIAGKTQLGYHYLRKRWNEFRKAFKIPAVYKIYGMKHTGNSKMAAMGVNAQLQQLHNGHASLEYTQRYNSGLSVEQMEFLKKRFPEFGKAIQQPFTGETELIKVMKSLLERLSEMKDYEL